MKGCITLKKLLSLFITLALIFSALPSFAAGSLELDSLAYDTYMRGETIIVSGSTSVPVTLGLYYPEEASGTAKYIMTVLPSELSAGIEIETDTDPRLWPDGVWKIVVQSGEMREELEFELAETVDRGEEPVIPPTNPGNGNVPTVTIINLEPSELTLSRGESKTVSVTTTASSLSLEVDDENIVSASLSGKTLTVKGLKAGSAAVWVKTNNNYSELKVTVKSASHGDSSAGVTEPDEEPTSPPTEEPTSPPTEEPDEDPSEPPKNEPDEPPYRPEVTFEDISGHWAESDIVYLAQKGIVNGMSESVFAPEESVTRAQFVTMLQNLFGFTAKNEEEIFGDVKKTDWYFSAVSAAYESGIAKGSEGNFNPNALVTRQDMAVFAYRAAQYAGFTFTDIGSLPFDDDDKIASYAKEAVYYMKGANIINGMTEAVFDPQNTATRAQAARIIANISRLIP